MIRNNICSIRVVFSCTLALAILIVCSANTWAQGNAGDRPLQIGGANAKAAPGNVKLKLARPAGNAMRVELSPELKWVLETWEKQGKNMAKLEGKHKRFVYDFTFGVEKRSSGEFYYEAPDKGRLDVTPVKVATGELNKKGPRGKQFYVKPDKAEAWISDGVHISAIDVTRKEYQRLEIPEQGRGKNIVDGPLPFLFGISVEKAKARYRMQLHTRENGGMHDLKKGIVHIKVYPLWRQDAANWEEAEVLLNASTFLPTAIKLVHPGKNSETVYTFYGVKKNAPRGVFAFWKQNPFQPNLKAFKELKMSTGDAPKSASNAPGRSVLK